MRARDERPAQKAPASASRLDESDRVARADSADPLTREMRHLAATRAAVTRSPARALALVERARDSFPDPFYRQEWDALYILALIGVERIAEARRDFASFVARYPKSPFRTQIERALQDGS